MTEAQKKKAHREEMARKEAEKIAARRAREEEKQFQKDYTEFMKTRETYNDRAFQLFVTKKRKEREAFEEEKKRIEFRQKSYEKLNEVTKKQNKEKQEKAEKESNLQDYINSAQTKSTNISKEMTKILKKNTSEMFKSTNIIDDQSVKMRKQRREEILGKIRAGGLSDEKLRNYQLELGYLNSVGDIQTDLVKQTNEGTIAEQSKDDIRKSILEKMGLTLEAYDNMSDEEKRSAKLMVGNTDRVERMAEKISEATQTLSTDSFQSLLDEVKTLDNEFDQLIDKGKKYGAILKDSVARSMALRAAVVGVAASFAKDVFDSAKDVRQELGLSVAESAKLGFQISRNAKLLSMLGGNAAEVKNFSVAIAKEFGNIGDVTDDVLKQFVDISAATGLTGENAAKLVNSIMSIQGGTLETSLNTIKIFENLARAEGVSSKLVLEDVAEDAELFATFAKEGGKNLAEAALQSRKLGISLSTVSQMADKLLQFESSIESQMEAQVILGRALNLDKARELALMGNLEGLQSEVLKQVGSQAEFEAMLPLQRKALADAIGTSVADLGRMVRGERTSAQLAEDRAKAEVERGETQLQIMKSLENMSKITAGLAAIDQLRNVLGTQRVKNLIAENSLLNKGLTASITKGVVGLLGSKLGLVLAGVAAVGGAALYLNKGKEAEGFAIGGMVGKDGGSVAPSDTVPAMLTPGEIVLNKAQQRNVASSVVGGSTKALESKMDSQIKESKEMNQNTKKLLEQNQFLMTKLIRTTGGLKGDA